MLGFESLTFYVYLFIPPMFIWFLKEAQIFKHLRRSRFKISNGRLLVSINLEDRVLPPALFDRSQGIFILHASKDSHAQPGLFNAVGCHCRESEQTAIINLASAGIEPTPIRPTIEQRPSGIQFLGDNMSYCIRQVFLFRTECPVLTYQYTLQIKAML